MPTYEYSCKKCGQRFEVFQSFADKPLRSHQECGGDLRKVFHARGIVFKGGGFYATDRKGGSDSSDGASPTKPEKAKPEKTKPEKTAAAAD